jgi:AcrR family transcriptional regulator
VPRPKVHDDALRARLRDRAGQLLSSDGVAGLSLRKLASDVGTSTTAVYSLFGGKPGLVKTLVDEAFRRLGARLAAVPDSGDPATGLVALGLAYRDAALDDPHLYDAMFGSAELDDESRGLRDAAFEPLVKAVERAMRADVLRGDANAATVALGLWAALHGLVSLQLRDAVPAGGGDPGEGFAAMVRAAVDGWRS